MNRVRTSPCAYECRPLFHSSEYRRITRDENPGAACTFDPVDMVRVAIPDALMILEAPEALASSGLVDLVFSRFVSIERAICRNQGFHCVLPSVDACFSGYLALCTIGFGDTKEDIRHGQASDR